MSKLILITGAGGFIGVNLVKKLLDMGFYVIGVDNFCSSNTKKSDQFKNNNHYELIRADICDDIYTLLKQSELIKNHIGIDQIYNLACPASPPRYLKLPLETIRTCTIGITNILEIARKYNSTVIQASTSEIYGDPLEHPQTENYRGNVNTVGPRSCYDEGKRIAETICFEYRKNFEVNIKIARIFNTYGPFMDADDGRVVSTFINQTLNNKDLTIFGDGNQTRSFQYISDLIEGLVKLMNSDKELFGPINLGNPNEFTIKELADLILNMVDTKSEIIYQRLPIDDPKQRSPDITKAKEILNWMPTIQLKDGLVETINYFNHKII